MIIILSPAKRFSKLKNNYYDQNTNSTPLFLKEMTPLLEKSKELSSTDIEELMKVSKKIADLNHNRFQNFPKKFSNENSKPAILSFYGDAFQTLDAESFTKADFQFAEKHFKILSGLFGILSPSNLIPEYRLEMGTKLLSDPQFKKLSDYWQSILTPHITQLLEQENDNNFLVNLASKEYFSAININEVTKKHLVITPVFKQNKNGQTKIVSILSKRARGLMTRYLIQNKVQQPEVIKDFNLNGYKFIPQQSDKNTYTFIRDNH